MLNIDCILQGEYLWPGFGENIRVLDWILRRCDGQEGNAEMSIVGYIPKKGKINHTFNKKSNVYLLSC